MKAVTNPAARQRLGYSAHVRLRPTTISRTIGRLTVTMKR
jgi:hypothetical protein